MMIDEELQRELRKRFNPDGSLLRREQLRMLDILRYIDNVCRENGIRYWLSSGTLLGAVRHGGFIPWDDDLDIEMLKEDYDRFVALFPSSADYVLQTYKSDRFYLLPFAKVRDRHTLLCECGNNSRYRHRGLFVDVFCLEQSPRFAYVAFGAMLYPLIKLQRMEDGRISSGVIFAGKTLYYGLVSLLRPLLRMLPHKSLNHLYGCGPRWRSRDMKSLLPLSSVTFEGYEFPAPNDTDAYLRKMFGGYDTLPNLDTLRIHSSDCIF